MYKNRNHIYRLFKERKGQIAILIDPEEVNDANRLKDLIQKATFAKVDYFFIGGSTVTRDDMEKVVRLLKDNTSIPIVIFPGSSHQLSPDADAILFLSLLSGRNPDFLIGHHILASKELHNSSLEIIPTSYILIDGGTKSSVAYVSQTNPIPNGQHQIAIQTAIAGAMQGKKIVYYDAGSGATIPVSPTLLKKTIVELPDYPVIVGGGIRTMEEIISIQSLANVIVIGNHIEDHPDFILDLANIKKQPIR